MPEQIGDRFYVHAGFKPGHGGAVPQGVHSDACGTNLLSCGLDDSEQVARLDRPAELVSEHQTGVDPLVPGLKPFDLLLGAMKFITRLSVAAVISAAH